MHGLRGTALAKSVFIGACVECFFCGIYSAIFAMYFQYHISTRCADKKPGSIIFYSLCTLYILSVIIVIMDISKFVHDMHVSSSDIKMLYPTCLISTTISGCCDFIAQSVLIYRCWIVWNRDIRVIIIPLILTFTFLGLWTVGAVSEVFVTSQPQIVVPGWAHLVILASIVISLVVNAFATGLIVFKIVKIYLEVKPFYSQTVASGTTGGSKLRPIICVLLESGFALFAIQLAYLVIVLVQTRGAVLASQPSIPIQRMLNGITPTIIQVRVSMGLSFHDKESMVEATSSLHFESVNDPQKSMPYMGNSGRIDSEENRDNHIGVKKSDEIDHN